MPHEPDTIVICADCHLPVGPFRDQDGRIVAVLDCDCHRIGHVTETSLPVVNSIRAWEQIGVDGQRGNLCHGCATTWLSDISRFSSWFCADCVAIVRGVNTTLRRGAIPLGRHTLINRVPARGQFTVTADAKQAAGRIRAATPLAATHRSGTSVTDDVADQIRAIHETDGLRRHLAREVSRILAASGTTVTSTDGDHALAVYLESAGQVHDGSAAAILHLATVWATALEEDGR